MEGGATILAFHPNKQNKHRAASRVGGIFFFPSYFLLFIIATRGAAVWVELLVFFYSDT